MKWVERYQYYMRRTRLLGMIGAGLVVASGGVEMWYAANNIVRSEATILHPEFIEANLDVFLFAPVMAVVFILRILVLHRRPDRPYRQYFASWMASMTIALALLWWELPTYHPLKGGCAEGKICFGIYDIARPSFLALFSLYYICGSLFRVTVTGLYAALKHRYK